MLKKERPIIFSTPMVQAILEGNKAQTRRPIPVDPDLKHLRTGIELGNIPPDDRIITFFKTDNNFKMSPSISCKCPYGIPSDLLWVREKHRFIELESGEDCIQFADETIIPFPNDKELCEKYLFNSNFDKWRPAKYLPKKLARIWLEITDIRVEKLKKISVEDIKAEGVYPNMDGIDMSVRNDNYAYCKTFIRGWDRIYAKKGYSWEFNPWCWVIEFKRIKP